MADTTATPASGGISKEEVAQIVKDALAGAISPFAEALKTIQAENAALKESVAKIPAGVKAEDVAKLVTEQIASSQKAQTEAAAKSTAKADLRKKVIAAKLPGVPASVLASLPDTEDEAALTAAAEAIRKDLETLKVKLPDVGGASRDGGDAPGTGQKVGVGSGLSAGVQQLANEIKLPA